MLSSGQSQSSDLVDWPTDFTGDGGSVVDIDIENVYRRELSVFHPRRLRSPRRQQDIVTMWADYAATQSRRIVHPQYPRWKCRMIRNMKDL